MHLEDQPKSFLKESEQFEYEMNRPRVDRLISNSLNASDQSFLEETIEKVGKRSKVLSEAPASGQAQIASFTKQLIPYIARTAGSTMSLDKLVHVAPMTSDMGQVTYLRRIRGNNTGAVEAMFKTINTNFGGAASPVHSQTHDVFTNTGDADTTPADGIADNFAFAKGLSISAAEALGEFGGTAYDNVSVRLDKVFLKTIERKLKTTLSPEAVEDALNEQNANILQESMLAARGELERTTFSEVYSRILLEAKWANGTRQLSVFDYAAISADNAQVFGDKNFLLVAKLQQLAADIESETMEPGLRFNVITTPRVARTLKMISQLHVQTPLSLKSAIDFNTFYSGTIGDFDIYVDPFYNASAAGGDDYICVVAKGADAGKSALIFGSYVPLAIANAVDPDTFYQVIGFRTRYAVVTNPLATDTPGANNGDGVISGNRFARKFVVKNIGL